MKLTVTTPTEVTYSGNADTIFLETDQGPITVLPHHASLVTQTQLGEIRIVDGAKTHEYLIHGGIFTIDNKTDEAQLLCLSADDQGTVTKLGLQNYLDEIGQLLQNKSASDTDVSYQLLHGDKIALERKISKLNK